MVAPINILLVQKKSGWNRKRWGKEEGKDRMRRRSKWEEKRNTGE